MWGCAFVNNDNEVALAKQCHSPLDRVVGNREAPW